MKKKRLFALLTVVVMVLSIFSINPAVATENQDTHQQLEVVEGFIEEPSAMGCSHSWAYFKNFNGTHRKSCIYCGEQATEAHSVGYHPIYYKNGSDGHYTKCQYCYADMEMQEHDNYVSSSGNDSHFTMCRICGYSVYESHNFGTGIWYKHDDESHFNYCNTCNATVYKPHDLTYSSGAFFHRKRCNDCSYDALEDHVGSGNIMGVDPFRKEECKHCGYWFDLPCEHSGSYTMNSSTNGHYKVCNLCAGVFDSGSHTFKYVEDGVDNHNEKCSVCEYVKDGSTEAHSWKYVNNGSSNHKQICRLCNYEKGTQAHSFSYKADGSNGHYKYCNICGRSETTTAHSYNNDTCTICDYVKINCRHIEADIFNVGDPINHRVICSECNQTLDEPHSFDGYNSCIKCGYYNDENEY